MGSDDEKVERRKKMKVLVTGGAGFIGTNLIKRLLKDGQRAVSVDNYSTGKKENHQEGCRYHDIDLSIPHPLTSFSLSQSLIDIDVIYHIAAQTSGYIGLVEPERDVDCNMKGTLNIKEIKFGKGKKECGKIKISIS